MISWVKLYGTIAVTDVSSTFFNTLLSSHMINFCFSVQEYVSVLYFPSCILKSVLQLFQCILPLYSKLVLLVLINLSKLVCIFYKTLLSKVYIGFGSCLSLRWRYNVSSWVYFTMCLVKEVMYVYHVTIIPAILNKCVVCYTCVSGLYHAVTRH